MSAYTTIHVGLKQLGKRHYIKHDLQPCLPADHPNSLRMAQHHGEARP